MKKKLFVKILKITGAVTAVLAIVLCVHIYQVTRPPVANENTVSMARIDFKQDLSKEDSVKITTWLYNQKGVDYVFCNTEGRTAVFSFYPVRTNATELAKSLAMNLDYKAERYMPSAEAMKGGCPVQ
jgi:hypothetical protein